MRKLVLFALGKGFYMGKLVFVILEISFYMRKLVFGHQKLVFIRIN